MKWIVRIAAVLIGILVLGTAVLLAMGQRSSAGQSHASVEIQAAPEQVWPWLEDTGRLKQWVSWLVEVRDQPGSTPGVGTRRVWVMRDENNGGQLMELPFTYTEYAPPSRMTVSCTVAGAFSGRQKYHLTPLGNGKTRVDSEGDYAYQMWLARLMEPVITPAAEKKMRSDLVRLKDAVEKGEAKP